MKKSSVISLLASAALIGFCGCASDQAQKSQEPAKPQPVKPAKDTRSREERLKVGMTEDEVRQAIGNPRGKSTNSDGSQTWMYNDAEKVFIPNYSLFGGKIHNTVVIFDTNGTVKNWSSNSSGRY
ncbi:MAG TPA: outer membrane protein assembly factor BamE [Candidatus Limnocylindrales bacterium]|nr:outer membrane protein assembly factor BamE [Candidatus Limnocylindrales bacterium]